MNYYPLIKKVHFLCCAKCNSSGIATGGAGGARAPPTFIISGAKPPHFYTNYTIHMY